ncbi:hypothetical protein FACS189429_1730 [Bacteroidia bacterium]|nr:hypothetical protein FACS189429_1730 [Bacteroidia bacterium]GHV45180.1 hypothetical protein FACS1894180_7430 [Bacteroidia bacterium]
MNKSIFYIAMFLCFSTSVKAQIDTLHFVDNRCFDYWQKHKKYPNSDSIMCFGNDYSRTKLDSSSYRIDYYDRDTTYLDIQIKKDNNMLYFKNEYSGNEYSLFFNFNTLKGGKIKLENDTILLEDSTISIWKYCWYQVTFLKKIKIRGEYLYKLMYKPIGFFSSGTSYMYFTKNGEYVMYYFVGYWGNYCLRTDYFETSLTYKELQRL